MGTVALLESDLSLCQLVRAFLQVRGRCDSSTVSECAQLDAGTTTKATTARIRCGSAFLFVWIELSWTNTCHCCVRSGLLRAVVYLFIGFSSRGLVSVVAVFPLYSWIFFFLVLISIFSYSQHSERDKETIILKRKGSRQVQRLTFCWRCSCWWYNHHQYENGTFSSSSTFHRVGSCVNRDNGEVVARARRIQLLWSTSMSKDGGDCASL